VPLSFFEPTVMAASGTTVSVRMKPELVTARADDMKLDVQMAESTVATGFLRALDRIRSTRHGLEANISLVELLMWLDVLAATPNTKSVKGVYPARILIYLRGRCHHHLAFAIFDGAPEASSAPVWCWLPWSMIPDTDQPERRREELEQAYNRDLNGRPVLETLRPLESTIRKLAGG